MKNSYNNRKRLPPTHALLALDAFAQLGTVGKAAQSLAVTRSAVSHRIALLEDALGFDVIERSGKGVALTTRGRQYAQDIHKSLTILTQAQGDADCSRIGGVLRVSSTAEFAGRWLCAHIASFREECANLRLEINTPRTFEDVWPDEADVCIVFGHGNWPRYLVQHLYDVEFIPLCSPSLLNVRRGAITPADVLQFPLLHLRRRDDWDRWFDASGIEFAGRSIDTTFSDMRLVEAAAIAGQGFMMGDERTSADALAAGRLVSPFATKIPARGGYYLLSEPRKQTSPAVAAFTNWLLTLISRIRSGGTSRHM